MSMDQKETHAPSLPRPSTVALVDASSLPAKPNLFTAAYRKLTLLPESVASGRPPRVV